MTVKEVPDIVKETMETLETISLTLGAKAKANNSGASFFKGKADPNDSTIKARTEQAEETIRKSSKEFGASLEAGHSNSLGLGSSTSATTIYDQNNC